MGDMLRAHGANAGDGSLVDDRVANELMFYRLIAPDAARGAILDGYPRTTAQMEALFDFMLNRGPISAFSLETSHKLAKKRLLGRKEGRIDDKEYIIERRLSTFELETAPILWFDGLNVVKLDGSKSPKEVMSKALAHVFKAIWGQWLGANELLSKAVE
jgi:adenylate kinase